MNFEGANESPFGRTTGTAPFEPNNGTTYVTPAFSGNLAFYGHYRFGLYSVDLAEYSTVFPFPIEVTFIGYRWDNTTVQTTFTTDGIIDGNGPLVDFQTFYFPMSFTNLSRVEIPREAWAMDNLVIGQPVPEPHVASLFAAAAGLALVCFRPRQRKKNNQ